MRRHGGGGGGGGGGVSGLGKAWGNPEGDGRHAPDKMGQESSLPSLESSATKVD